MSDTDSAIAEEQARLRQLRMLVDLTANLLAQGGLSRREADELVAATKQRVLALFPDKEATYEMILAPRFARLTEEFALRPSKVLPFKPRG